MKTDSISLNKIKLGKNSRLLMTEEDLSELMASMKQGLLQPIGVKKNGSGYEVVYGNRRFLAASKLGWASIDCVVVADKNDHDSDIMNLTENVQRRNVSLAEVGRYVDFLAKNMTTAEIAARLGVAPSYIKSCLTAYREVPQEFRSDLEVRVGGKKTSGTRTTAGKIPISTATAIINTQKSMMLTREHIKKLFQAAKTSDKFEPTSIKEYAAALKAGKKDFLSAVEPLKQLSFRLFITENEYARLHKKHVENGIYKSVTALFLDILEGKRSERIKIVKNQG